MTQKRLRKIHHIEALRQKIGCQTYEELENYGYDVAEYFARQQRFVFSMPNAACDEESAKKNDREQ